jgi:hypothetical protein
MPKHSSTLTIKGNTKEVHALFLHNRMVSMNEVANQLQNSNDLPMKSPTISVKFAHGEFQNKNITAKPF